MSAIRDSSKPARTTFVLLAALFALLAATAARPATGLAAPVEPPEPPQLAIEPGSYDFGLQPLNWGSREASFQLRNAGAEAIQVGSPEIVGPGREVFWTGYSPCYGSFLQPGESCSVQVYFGPHEAVEYAAQFRVSVGPYSFGADLTGTGGRASFSPPSNPTDFGVAKVGSAGTTREIEVTNTGNMPGGVFIAVIAGGAIGSFQILDEDCTGVELVPAATCTVQIRFQPVSEGVKKAMLGLFGESEGPTPVILTGVGTAPDPAPAVDSAPAAAGGPVSASPTSGSAARPTAKPRRHRPGIRRRHRRANLHSAHRVAVTDPGNPPEGR
jgi:hypothetical protein